MRFPRRLAGLAFVVSAYVVAGCGTKEPSPPETPTEPVVENTVGILPDASGGLIRGGKSDAPPPPPRQPRPGEIVLPKDGGAWPWNLAAAPDPRPFRPVAIPDADGTVTGLAVRPAADRAVVTLTRAAGHADTRVLWCDTAAGTVLAEWEVKGAWVPWDLSPDGDRILVCRAGTTARPDTLAVWTVTADKELKRKAWQPHGAPEIEGALVAAGPGDLDVVWAAWVGPDRIVSASRAGQLRTFAADTLKQVGTIDATPGRPAVTPDGTRVLFLVRNGVALLDPAAGTVGGVRRTGRLTAPAVLAVSPNGKTLAVGGHDRVTFLDLADGDVWDTLYPKPDDAPKGVPDSFGWAGDRYLLADRSLYDLTTPAPVWEYRGAARARCLGRQTWAVLVGGEAGATLRPFELPHPGADAKVTARTADPGVFLLRPGDGIRIDVAGVPADQQIEVGANLDRRVRAVGYRPDAAAAVILFASVDATGSEAAATFPGHPSVPYTRRPARLKLVKDGRVLWEQGWVVEPPLGVPVFGKRTPAEIVRECGAGRPNYRLFAAAPLPLLVRGPKAPPGAFGASELKPDGIRNKK
jgi:hypothetical protein